MTSTLSRSLLVLGLTLPVCAQAMPPMRPAVEDCLPTSTFLCIRSGGLGSCVNAAAALPAGEVVQRFLANLPPELRQERLDQHLDRIASHVREVSQRLGVAPADLRQVLRRPMAVGIGRPTIEGFGPSIALAIDCGENADSVARLFAAAEALAERNHALDSVKDVEIGGVPMQKLQVHEGPAIYCGDLRGFFLVSNSRGYVAEIVQVLNGQAPPLARDTDLGAQRARLGGAPLATVYANTERLCAMADPLLPYETAEWADALGLGALRGIFAGAAAGEHGGTEVVHVGMTGNPHGLLRAAVSKPLDLSMATTCSKNTVAFAAVRLDAPAVVAAFDRFLDLLPAGKGDEVRKELHRNLTREFRHSGTSPQEVMGLLHAFGDQATFALSLEKAAVPKPELLVRLAVRDADKVAVVLQRLEAAVAREGLEWKDRDVDGHTVRFCNVDIEDKLKLSPCYVLTKDALLLGSDTACLVRALRMGDAGESFAAEPDFAEMARVADGAFGVLHLRLFRAAELGWRTVETLGFPQLDAHKEQLGFGSEALPDGETMAKALGTVTTAARVDESGLTITNQGSLGLGVYLAAFGALADDVLDRATENRKIY